MPGAIEDCGLQDLWLWLVGRRRRFRVVGASMEPVLKPGDVVFVDTGAYRREGPRAGELVVARHPYRTDAYLIKRVASVADPGQCLLAGDNPAESTDSRSFGAVSADGILGRVTSRLA